MVAPVIVEAAEGLNARHLDAVILADIAGALMPYGILVAGLTPPRLAAEITDPFRLT